MKRLGLIGFNTNSGLGVVNRQMADHLPVGTWLVRDHRHLTTLPQTPHDVPTFTDPDTLLHYSDVILFAENPLWLDLPKRAKTLSKRVVCVPMQEWFPPFDHPKWTWPKYVDLFICPTLHCYDELKDRYPCVHVPWPVDAGRFRYHQRQVCRRFVFTNGNGGWRGRKGGDVIREAKRLWPEMPLVVFSQTESEWPPGTDYRGRASDPREMYAAGDVLLCPHSVDGIGLEIGEALACGMPVVATEGRPWDEYLLLAGIPAIKERRRIKREVNWYVPDPAGLMNVCKAVLGTDVSRASTEAYLWTRSHSWDKWRGTLVQTVMGDGYTTA